MLVHRQFAIRNELPRTPFLEWWPVLIGTGTQYGAHQYYHISKQMSEQLWSLASVLYSDWRGDLGGSFPELGRLS